jgi:hypothetical protein
MRLVLIAVSAAVFSLFAAAGAQAAPQTLLLVAQGDDLHFTCAGEHCSAEGTSLCLQYERASPTRGTPYELVNEARYGTGRPTGLTLIGQTASGTEKTLPLDSLKIASERDHMAVRFRIDKALLAAHGVKTAKLRVAHNVVLAPVWGPGDANPQLESDIELSMGPMRTVAEGTLKHQKPEVRVAHMVRDTLNALPRGRVATNDERKTAFDKALTLHAQKDGGVLQRDVDEARKNIASCDFINDGEMWYRGYYEKVSRYRGCLGQRHDNLIKGVNQTYWKSMQGAGS